MSGYGDPGADPADEWKWPPAAAVEECRIGELSLTSDGGTILVYVPAELVKSMTLGEWQSAVGRRVLADALLHGAAAAGVAEIGDRP